MAWARDDEIEWREVWQGRVLSSFPIRVVADREDILALYIAEGTPFAFPEQWPWAPEHPWQRPGRWQGHGGLVLHRPGDAYTVWVFWEGADRAFSGWYVNLQAPLRRSDRAVDTFDHELDIRVTPDGAWQLKDDELLDQRVREGRFSAAEAAAIRATASDVIDALKHGRRWWSDAWASWTPPDGSKRGPVASAIV